MANMLLIMGGQLAYLYIVGPISMDDGRPMALPEIPFLGLLITILIAAGGLITAAILQKKPAPIRYVSVNSKPYVKQIQRKENSTENQQYRPIYPGQYSTKTSKLHYNKSEEKEDLNWKESNIPINEPMKKKIGSLKKQELQFLQVA